MSGLFRIKNVFCPVCGRPDTLYLNGKGMIDCIFLRCPRPAAAHEILSDRETEHVVDLGEEGFTLRHPVRERLDDALLDCDVHARLTSGGQPASTGRFRVKIESVEEPGGIEMTFEPLGDPE